jgi:hypothetical protein
MLHVSPLWWRFLSRTSLFQTMHACMASPLELERRRRISRSMRTRESQRNCREQGLTFTHRDFNETYIYGSNGSCEASFSAKKCTTFRGGQYSTDNSTSDLTVNRPLLDTTRANLMSDSVQLTSNLTLPRYEFGIPQQDLFSLYAGHGIIGVGRNSTFLSTLKEAGRIGSRTFSIFWGLVGGPRRVPGSFVLGGFDQSIAGGSSNYTAPITYNDACGTGMLITINDISLNWPNGTDSSIFDGSRSAAMQACIAPDFAGLMTLPYDYWQTFMDLAGGKSLEGDGDARSFGLNFFTMLFQPAGV